MENSTFARGHNLSCTRRKAIPGGEIKPKGIKMLNVFQSWASEMAEGGVHIPQMDNMVPCQWPYPVLILQPSEADADMLRLKSVFPKSDWAVFHGTPIVLVELDSSSANSVRTTDSSGKEEHNSHLDENRGLTHVAFVVRSTNIALAIDDYCLPYIWVDKQWRTYCYVVYQSGADILAYPLQYNGKEFFDLTDQNAKTHFQL
ncbi:hypothetical protein BT96DRAFT_458257 [Gymnopus androsaceus JB14]|uniref:Uncharacterized protein n=1 Tax=Gymnopus androsaceus JB14 TaxID=1447944 RepID=A0A6A4IJL7_9AGAR|nr:hypothetical protein BT96DRAFT_458257 [Gymnopus androsaceus JB14]